MGTNNIYSIEVCAGAGGQALGLEQAKFSHEGLVEIDKHCCNTLRLNRPKWQVYQQDINYFDGTPFKGIDLFSGGLPCPPFSMAGKQLGKKDERNLFPTAIRLIDEIRPKTIMIENVRGIFSSVFDDYRKIISSQIEKMGYTTDWRLLKASDFGVPQLRPRAIFIAVKTSMSEKFDWPTPKKQSPPTVGEMLYDLMSSNYWKDAESWRACANDIAPTIVGGSLKHGGPDLGPTRAKKAWAALGVDGHGLVEDSPEPYFSGMPRLTVRMVARLQGFPDNWQFTGKKTPAYRQVGNAFPPPIALAVGKKLMACLKARKLVQVM